MSNITETITTISKALSEPEWLLSWRKKMHVTAGELPVSKKHGIAITALYPEADPELSEVAEYHVDSSKGLEIYTWKEAMVQEEIAPLVKGFMESDFFPRPTDRFRALGLSQFASGLVLYVQPNMADDGSFITERLLLSTTVPKGSAADVVIVIVKEGAALDLAIDTKGGDTGSVFLRTLLVVTERDAKVRITQLSSVAPGAMLMNHARSLVSGNSRALWRDMYSGDALHSSITENLLIGPKAHATVLQGLVGAGSGVYDLDVSVRHLADDSTSEIRTRGLAHARSRMLYRGLIDMHQGVHRVKGEQDAKFLVMSKDAKVDAIPSLDIASNDVSCSHKLSVSHVKEGDMFYPKLRGLSDDESKQLFLEGHFADVWKGEENIDMMSMTLPLLWESTQPHA